MNKIGSLSLFIEYIICENFVVNINRFKVATQIHILKVKRNAFSSPSIVNRITIKPNEPLTNDVPGVISINGEAIAAAKIGIKRVARLIKYSRGILEKMHNVIIIVKRITKG